MSWDTTAAQEALQSVKQELLAAAQAEAGRTVAAATEAAEHRLAEARARAADVVERAARQGETDAAAALAQERSRGRRHARAVVLAARAQAYDRLRDTVHQELATLAEGPRAAQVSAALRERAAAALGADAEIVEAAEEAGRVRGRADGRWVEVDLRTLAEASLAAAGPEVEQLWAP